MMNRSQNSDLYDRRGIFRVYRKMLFNDVGYFEPFNIISTHDKIDEVEYMAVSPLFDPVPEGEKVPEYEVIQTKDKLGNVIFEVERLDEKD